MTHTQKKFPSLQATGINGTQRNSTREQIITASTRGTLRECPRLAEPFPGRALAIRTAKTDGDLARACVRYAGALMLMRVMRGQAPDLACEVVAGSVAQHVRYSTVEPKPSRRQVARVVEAAFAFAERAA